MGAAADESDQVVEYELDLIADACITQCLIETARSLFYRYPQGFPVNPATGLARYDSETRHGLINFRFPRHVLQGTRTAAMDADRLLLKPFHFHAKDFRICVHVSIHELFVVYMIIVLHHITALCDPVLLLCSPVLPDRT